MTINYGIIDLFAGPGGLGEGFSQAGREAGIPMEIRLSVEMDQHAVATLRLRSFLRSFDDGFPEEYYRALESGGNFTRMLERHPDRWQTACSEVRQLVLGEPGVFESIAPILDRTREEFGGNTILIGGPPCQAYSLAGRSRNKGKQGYVAEDDQRHYLYREYVRILERLRPAAFVMENVKGMLSSKVDGGGIFTRVLDDLEGAADGYRLLPLTVPSPADGSRAQARDFLVRAEEHGVPQARHRVIILGIRRDVLSRVCSGATLQAHSGAVTVDEALRGMPTLRSGLSKEDSRAAWQKAVRDHAERIAALDTLSPDLARLLRQVARSNSLPDHRVAIRLGDDRPPAPLDGWLCDPQLNVVLHHDTRGHIPADLGRYLFSSTFTKATGRAPKLSEFPDWLQPEHRNRESGDFADRFRTQAAIRPSTTVTSHISKDGHYFIHPDPSQCRSLTVREAARLQTFPDNYFFCGPRTMQYHQVGNAVPPYLAWQIAKAVRALLP
ncbi:DNA cytosine methyltransferase [Paracoccus sp. Ld10]|uniref:DNA cytosine methyltransferase n=1 Tax=Paracoccus sp. Ld10 TaxID=649158 RepID=UPI00386F0329